MAINPSAWSTRIRRWLPPTWVALGISLALLGWVGWSGYRAWFDRTLPTSTISAHQFRLNTTQLNSLENKLRLYHQPAEPPNVSNTIVVRSSS